MSVHQPAPHPQLAITLEAAQQPTIPGEPVWSGISGGLTITMTRSQWAWLCAQKARRHARAYRASRKAQVPTSEPVTKFDGPRNEGDIASCFQVWP